MTETYHCKCGLSLKWTWRGNEKPERVEQIKAIVLAAHQGEDHGPTDSRTAYRVRRKAEAAAR